MKLQGCAHLPTGEQGRAERTVQPKTNTCDKLCAPRSYHETSIHEKCKSELSHAMERRRGVMLSILALGTSLQTFSRPAVAEEADLPLKKHISELTEAHINSSNTQSCM